MLENSFVLSVNTNGKTSMLRLDLYLKGKYVKNRVGFWSFKHDYKLSVNDIHESNCLA